MGGAARLKDTAARLSYLRVDISDVLSLLRVMALVDQVSAVVVLADDFAQEITVHGGL